MKNEKQKLLIIPTIVLLISALLTWQLFGVLGFDKFIEFSTIVIESLQ